MKWIEMIGPSGVGKSYFFKALCEKRSTNKEWITKEEGFQKLYQQCVDEKVISRKRRAVDILKLRTYRRNCYKLLPTSEVKKTIDKFGGKFSLLSEVMLSEHEKSQDYDPRKKLKMISWYYRSRLEPFIVLFAQNLNEKVLFEDGILHNNRGIRRINKYLKTKRTINQVWKPGAIIYCTAEHEVIFERILNRNRLGNGTFLQRDLSDDQIKQQINRSVKAKEDVAYLFKNHGVPVLELDMGNRIELNCKLTNNFIADL